jgi:hypothetical protein
MMQQQQQQSMMQPQNLQQNSQFQNQYGVSPQQAMNLGAQAASGLNQMGVTPQQAYGGLQAMTPLVPARPAQVSVKINKSQLR